MSAYMDMSAAELAAMLDVAAGSDQDTGLLSMLDEATLDFVAQSPAVREAQFAFSAARHAHRGRLTGCSTR
jgi:hypothetical protein